jgi:hypothetical protein
MVCMSNEQGLSDSTELTVACIYNLLKARCANPIGQPRDERTGWVIIYFCMQSSVRLTLYYSLAFELTVFN